MAVTQWKKDALAMLAVAGFVNAIFWTNKYPMVGAVVAFAVASVVLFGVVSGRFLK